MAETNFIYERSTGCAPVKLWARGVTIEDAAMSQIQRISALPFIHSHVAVMPDAHWGMGATVGTVIATKGAIVPAAVGVDIGCGMMAVKTDLRAEHLPDSLVGLRTQIEKAVPHGRTHNGAEDDRGAWHDIPEEVVAGMTMREESIPSLDQRLKWMVSKYPKLEKAAARAPHHMGTLGTGNHFIEVCLDEANFVWIMLHSGSRGIGNRIGSIFIELAKADMRRWFINLPDENLAYLIEGSENFDDYIETVGWAQEFALANRKLMMWNALKALRSVVMRPFDAGTMAINCHHNYVTQERHFGANVWVTRKGAVRAGGGELGIIPGSMGVKSFIVRGKGNHESFNSCSHGAGRAMSRGEAKRRFTVEDHATATAHVECRKDLDVIDETPGAYKDIDAVMAAQSDLVEIVHTLRQVVCVKG